MVSSEQQLVGRPIPRSDAPAKVTGSEHYVGDINLPGLLHARPVPSTEAHARLISIDTSAAMLLPGVVAVLTAADLPFDPKGGPPRALESVARTEIVYVGQPVAVVLADDEAIAEEAAALVVVQYEPLPPVLNIETALQPTSPLARALSQASEDAAEAAMHGVSSSGGAETPTGEAVSANVSSRNNILIGDIAQGFSAAAVTAEATFRTAWVHQGYLEPQVALAAPDGLGGVTVYASTQGIYRTRTVIAQALGLPQHQIRVVPMAVGGGFGGKFGLVEPLTAALALAVKRPVRLLYTRSDEMQTSNPTPAAVIQLKLGATADGMLTAMEGRVVCDTGAYPNSPLGAITFALACCYDIPAIEIRGFEVMTNRLGPGAYRAPGNPQASFAVEALIDELAAKLGIDRLTLRIRNAPVDGDARPDGKVWPRIGLKECLERLQEHPLWQQRPPRSNGRVRQGIGIASGGWRGGLEPATSLCQMDPEGTIIVVVGAVDLTGTHTSFRMIAADALGVDMEQIRVVGADSTNAPYAGGAGGSKTLYTVGQAVERAALEAKEQILALAAQQLEAAVEDLELSGNVVRVKGLPPGSREISLKALAGLTAGLGARHAPIAGRGISAQTANAPGFAAHLAHVQVDLDTGAVEILDYVAAQDVGRAINPAAVEGQIIGAVAQGVGWGLYEQMVHDDSGQVITGSLMDYALPRASYIPSVETLLLEIPSPDGPHGARGVGEPPVIPVAAALANAIYDATGVRVNELPITPQRLWQAIAATR